MVARQGVWSTMTNRCASPFERLRRPRRRLVVVVGLVGYPLSVVLLRLFKAAGLSRWLILGIFLAAMALTVAAVCVGYGWARGRIDGRGVRLDERDRALREQAYVRAQRVLELILVAAVVALGLYLTTGHTMRLNANTFLPVLMWVVVYIPALPALMLAWIEPNPPADA